MPRFTDKNKTKVTNIVKLLQGKSDRLHRMLLRPRPTGAAGLNLQIVDKSHNRPHFSAICVAKRTDKVKKKIKNQSGAR